LFLAEVAVRSFAVVSKGVGRRIALRDPMATVYQPYGNFGYRPKPGRFERFPNGSVAHYNSMGYRGPLVDVEKPPSTYRIVLLGGSTAAGYGTNDDQTIDAHMRHLLGARFPDRCVEVVNLAVGGYDSYQDFERMRVDGYRLSPDLVIVHSGINDVRNARYPDLTVPPDRRTLLWESALEELRAPGGPSLWTRAKHYSYALRLPGYLMELRAQRRTIVAVSQMPEAYDAALDYFATNVQRTVDLAVGLNASVVLSTPPSALSFRNRPNDPLEKSYWIRDAGTTESYRSRLSARMVEIARREHLAGRSVFHVSHRVPLAQFLDDAHLLGAGNETVARHLVETIEPQLQKVSVRASQHVGCRRPEPKVASELRR
jgi:lysophospholipase L1-like esterase